MQKSKGVLFVISGPSGAGKSTLVTELLKLNSSLEKSITFTTRVKRSSEAEGIDYKFISADEFLVKKKQGLFLEDIQIFDHYYATDKDQVEKILKNKNCVLVLDTEGAKRLMQRSDVVSIFIKTKNLETLKSRMVGRRSETQESMENRLNEVNKQMQHSSFFDYIVTNDIFEHALTQLSSIIVAQECKNRGKKP